MFPAGPVDFVQTYETSDAMIYLKSTLYCINFMYHRVNQIETFFRLLQREWVPGWGEPLAKNWCNRGEGS
jgi:hypothetical protein